MQRDTGPTSMIATQTVALLTILFFASPARSQTMLPPPSYSNSVHLLFDAPGLTRTDGEFDANADAVLSLPRGPYARLGMYVYALIDMPWTQDVTHPVLSAPDAAYLVAILNRAKARGLEFHVALDVGMSRGTWVYDAAFGEDRRNAQWYGDGALFKDSASMPGWNAVFATPSRYARKLRRHMESKTRETARLLVSLRKAYPETFLSASGDGEAELNFGGLDTTLPYEAQPITDYSPFAILEFRDWIQHTGLYAVGAPYEGEGFPEGGVAYQGEAGLAAFNVAHGTSFASWSLRYFNWSLTEPVDADPRAIPAAVYEGSGWNPLPASGADFIAGGFDAPRAWGVPSAAFHALWLRFRETMLHNFVNDFSDWITTTPDLAGTTFETERWFTHQIPADYLGGTYPGCALPDRRLLTSASTFDTAFPKNGRPGFTVFDVFTGAGYLSTSRFLIPEIQRRGIASWGLMEYSPLWPAGGNDPDIPGITTRIEAAVAAGAHVINFHTWSHFFSTSNAAAFSGFLQKARALPRDRATTSYVLPRVRGLRGDRTFGQVTLLWRPEVFFGNPEYRWTEWPGVDHFAVWRGPTSSFPISSGELAGQTTATSFIDTAPDAAKPFYKVVPVSTEGIPGEMSATWAQGFFPLAPCRIADTRESTGSSAASPALAAGSVRRFDFSGKCGIPENASAVSVNLTVTDSSASGDLQIVPADAAFTSATSIHCSPGKARANNSVLYLATDDTGGVNVRNNSTGPAHLIIDVNGYFQ